MIYNSSGKIVYTFTLKRIKEGITQSLLPKYAKAIKNKLIYIYFTTISKRKITILVSKFARIDFKENHLSINAINKDAIEVYKSKDKSKKSNFYILFCFKDKYNSNYKYLALNKFLDWKK